MVSSPVSPAPVQPHWRWRGASISPLPVILATYLALAIALSLVIPLGEAADEVSHRAYVGEITAHHRLPDSSGPASGEAFEPPLYYVLSSIVTAWVPNQTLIVQANPDASLEPGAAPNLLLHPSSEAFPWSNSALAWHLMRLVSIALGALTIVATYYLALDTFPADPDIAWGSAAFVAFLPAFLVVSSAVSSDNLIMTLAALIIWQWVRIVRQPPRLRHAVVLGVLLGLAVLAKLTGFLFWGLSAIVFVWLARDPRQRRLWVACAALTLALALCVGSPWLLRNLLVDGDIFAYSRMLRVTPRPAPMTLADWRQYALSMYTSFWGRFGGASHHWLPGAVYLCLAAVPLLAAIGLLRRREISDPRRLSRDQCVLLVLFAAVIATLLASHIRLAGVLGGVDLARQVFSALAPAAIILVLGLSRVTSHERAGLAALSAGMAVFALLFIAFAASTYAGRPQSLPVAHLPPQGEQVQVDFGNQLRLVDYQIQQQAAAAGENIEVTLTFQALTKPVDVYWLLLRLVGPQGAAATRDGVPANGNPTTDRWQPGQTFTSHHLLAVAPGTPPGAYTLELGLHPTGRWQWLPVAGKDTISLGEISIHQ